jgi:hypothetical protein
MVWSLDADYGPKENMNMSDMTLTTDQARDVIDGAGLVGKTEIAEHRWYTRWLIVFKRTEEMLGFYHLKPLSELQDGQDEFESDPVEIFPVVAETRTVTVYRRATLS